MKVLLKNEDILLRLKSIDIKKSLESAFRDLYKGEAQQPEKTIIEKSDGSGDVMIFSGLVESLGLFGVKISPFLESRRQEGLPPVTAYTILISSTNGKPELLIDSKYLTTIRTAETTALAIDKLICSNTNCKLAIIGSGELARYHLYTQVRDRVWQEINIFSPTLVNNPSRKDLVKDIYQEVNFCKNSDDAIKDADVVLLCTSSGTPVIDYNNVKVGGLVCSISTDAKDAHEIDPKALTEWDVYCDYYKTAPGFAGEMKIANKVHGWNSSSIIADLGKLCVEDIKVSQNTRFFRSTGLAIEDIAIASAFI